MKREELLFKAALASFPTGDKFQLRDIMCVFNELNREQRGETENEYKWVEEVSVRYNWRKLLGQGLIVEVGTSDRQNDTYWRDVGRPRHDQRTKAYRVADPQEVAKARLSGALKDTRKKRTKARTVELSFPNIAERHWHAYNGPRYNSHKYREVVVKVDGQYAGSLYYQNKHGHTPYRYRWMSDADYAEFCAKEAENRDQYESRSRLYNFVGGCSTKWDGVDAKFKTLKSALTALRRGKYEK